MSDIQSGEKLLKQFSISLCIPDSIHTRCVCATQRVDVKMFGLGERIILLYNLRNLIEIILKTVGSQRQRIDIITLSFRL